MTAIFGTLEPAQTTVQDVRAVEEFTKSLPEDSQIRKMLAGVLRLIESGSDGTLVASEKELTPAEVARVLGVSRAHVYKLMDRGDIPCRYVNKDRRASWKDVLAFQNSQDTHRRDFAVKVAHAHDLRDKAVEELAGQA